jgi:ribosomal protein S18 acetylase RimI-like enzyme
MTPPFIVMALPRSRTASLARFLSFGDWICGHDQLQFCRSLEDVQTWFTQPNIGTCETAAMPFWRLLMRYQPDIRIVTVRRPIMDVLASVMRAVPDADPLTVERVLRTADRKLDQIEARIPGVLSVQFEDLADEATCARVFEHCLPYPHDPAWWAAWNVQHVSGDLARQIRYAQAYLPQLQKLARAAKQETLAGLHRQHNRRLPKDGFVFQEEPFDTWLADAQPLLREHLAQTGQDPDGYALKNIPLLRQLDACGVMQITTARQNGKIFAYLMSLISPSLDERDILMAQNLLPYSSPDCPGLGRRLQSAAIDMLRAKGVSQVFARAGVRGDGPRLGSLYKRLGFVDNGTLHRLNL